VYQENGELCPSLGVQIIKDYKLTSLVVFIISFVCNFTGKKEWIFESLIAALAKLPTIVVTIDIL
jgi:hypothetical protein